MELNNEPVRVSAAALLRLRALAGGQYVLAHMAGGWSPFGGAIQMLGPVPVLDAAGWKPESNGGQWGRDARGTVPLQMLPVVHAYLATGAGADREAGEDCLRRELREEFAETGAQHLVDLVEGIRLQLSLTVIETPSTGGGSGTWRYLEIFDLVDCWASDTPERHLREQIIQAAKDPSLPRITTIPRGALTRRHAKHQDALFKGTPIASHAHYVTMRDF